MRAQSALFAPKCGTRLRTTSRVNSGSASRARRLAVRQLPSRKIWGMILYIPLDGRDTVDQCYLNSETKIMLHNSIRGPSKRRLGP